MAGESLKGLREERGWSQTELAAWLNKSLGRKYDRAQISRWESGSERTPKAVVDAVETERRTDRPRHAIVVMCGSAKGGVSKTTSALCIAYCLLAQGSKVLLIDCDSQGSATVHLGYSPTQMDQMEVERRTLYYALADDRPLADYIIQTPEPRLDLLPAFMSLADADVELALGKLAPLRQRIGEVRNQYDFIVLDTAPNLGAVTVSALEASDLLLVPCQTEALALVGLRNVLHSLENLRRRRNPGLRMLGILPTLFSARLTQDQATLEDLRRGYGDRYRIFDPIPRATVFAQAAASGVIPLAAVKNIPGRAVFEEIAAAARAAAKEMKAHVA
ncbi:AAA family ATPase [Azospirillum sp. Vi22]|uniref:AAA family ATPase n=1 Tax=Azospirillum baldaniorum TaxID=1064539 RepID=UPI00157B9E2F|nr:AAA family ATPase [Azospirillum baldaniorum]NUB08838.1 AAA family ATPase [Azospirillum baldaniorum]